MLFSFEDGDAKGSVIERRAQRPGRNIDLDKVKPSIETKVMSVRNASHQVTRRSRQSTVKIMSGRNASQQVTGTSPQPWKIGLATFC